MEGTYGPGCVHTCLCREGFESCNRFNGVCSCREEPCNLPVTSNISPPTLDESTTSPLTTGAILGAIVGVIVIVFLVLLTIILISGVASVFVKKRAQIFPSYSSSSQALVNSDSYEAEEGRISTCPPEETRPSAPPRVFCRTEAPPSYEEVVSNGNIDNTGEQTAKSTAL